MVKLSSIIENPISGEWGLEDLNKTGLPVLRTTNFTNEGIINYNNITTRIFFKKNIKEKFLKYGDILLEKSGGSNNQPVGRVVFFDKEDDKYLFNNFISILRIKNKEKYIPKYIFYLLYYNYINGRTIKFQNKTTGLHNLQVKSFINDFQVEAIPINKQCKIIKILDIIYNLIRLKKLQLSKLDQLVKSRFVEMFGDENSFHNWVTCKVDNIAEICVGIVIKPSQYYTLDIESGVKAFRSLNIGEMYIKNKDWVYFTKEGHQKNQKSIIKENDVLIVRSGSPGTACVATKEYAGYNAIDIIIAHPNCKKINPVFLAMFTNMPHGMNQIRENTGGAAQQHFNVGGYKNITIILPPLPLQEQFAAFVQQVEKAKSSVNLSLEKLETLKKSLMQEYFV